MQVRIEAQLEDLWGAVPLDQLTRGSLGGEPAVVHDHQPVAQLLGLVHVVRGQDQRDAALLEPEQPVPHHVPGLRVQAGGGLVEDQDLRLVDERAGDGQAALQAAGQRVDLTVGAVRELHELEQFGGPLPDDAPGQPEVPAVDEQVLPDGQLDVQRVVLRHHSEPGPDRRAVPDRVGAEDGQLTAGRRRDTSDHPHRGRLARAVWPEKAERFAPVQVEIDPVNRREAPESLGQAARADQYFDPRAFGHLIQVTWGV